LRTALAADSAEPAHLKVLGSADGETSIANLVGSGVEVELSLASSIKTPAAELFVNARVAMDPEDLTRVVEREAAAVAGEFGLSYEIRGMQSFRPGRPMPTHRMA
jgi:hypothetical protein